MATQLRKKTMKEILKNIVGFDGYQVSNFGRVKSLARKSRKNDIFLKPRKCTKGYLGVVLRFNKKSFSKRIHSLVAQAFLYAPINKKFVGKKLQINHLDGDKLNNHSCNLDWCTCQENIRHAIDNKLRKPNQYC